MSLNKKEYAMSFAAELHCLQTYSLPSLCSVLTKYSCGTNLTRLFFHAVMLVLTVNLTLQSPAKSLNEGLSRPGWPVGMFVGLSRLLTDVGGPSPLWAAPCLGLGPGPCKNRESMHTFIYFLSVMEVSDLMSQVPATVASPE